MPTTTAVTPGAIWSALIANGASAIQAAAIMGNMMAESSLNVESAARDSNGYYSYGLVQWNAASHPGASTLVTGNPTADLQSQINYLAHTGGFAAASGADAGTAAANFAHNYERCAACGYQGGSSQLSVRAANAQGVLQAAQSGNWTMVPSSSSVGTADLTSATGGQSIGIDTPLGKVTLLSAQEIRTVKAFSFIGVGGLVMVLGMGVLLAAFGRRELSGVIPIPIGRRGGSKRPDADDRLAERAARSREADAAKTGRTQDQRARDARRRTRSAPGPGRTRRIEPRKRPNMSADPADRGAGETPF